MDSYTLLSLANSRDKIYICIFQIYLVYAYKTVLSKRFHFVKPFSIAFNSSLNSIISLTLLIIVIMVLETYI